MECVDSVLEGLSIGKFVAVLLSNWDKEPVIGVIKELCDHEFQIHYWKGTLRRKWAPMNQFRSSEPWIDALPKSCIILHSFELTTDLKLQPTTRNRLKDKYTLLKSNKNIENR